MEPRGSANDERAAGGRRRVGAFAAHTGLPTALIAVGSAAVAALLAIGLMSVRGGDPSQTSSRPQADGWRQYQEDGFSLEAPKAWDVARDRSGRISIAGDRSRRVVIWPVFVPRRLDGARAGLVARELTSKVLPGIEWDEASPGRSGVARLVGASREQAAVSIFAYAPSPDGTAGYLYVTSAPRRLFAASAPTFGRILASFEARGEPVEGRAALRFTTWTDPAEGAFSVEIPDGWTASGGTERPSSVLVQASVQAVSPDGEIKALMTDALPLYVEPNAVLEFAGVSEGGTYTDPTGYSSPVRRYAPGARYLAEYVVPARAPGADIVRLEDRPELAAQLATYGINSYDAGEVEYGFERNGVRYTGGALCITERITLQGYGAWHTWRLFLVEAPTERYGEGVAALRQLAGSFTIDREWAERQSETTARQAGIISSMGDDIRETLSSGYWERQKSYDAMSERRSRATLEVDDVADPDTHTRYRVESGPSYFWLDPSGTIVGTETDTRPDVDFRELVILDR